MATIKPEDIPLDKIDQVIERLQKEKEARINAKVEAGEAIRVNVDHIGDEDIEVAKARALRGYGIPSDKPVHFNIIRYRYPEFCSDGVTPNPLNKPPPARDASPSDLEVAPSTSSRRYDDDNLRRPQVWEPQELIVGAPMTVWTEVRRPTPNHPGVISEGYFLIHKGRVHLCDHLGRAIPGYSDIAGIDPMARARKLLNAKARRERPDEFWRMSPVAPRHGGW